MRKILTVCALIFLTLNSTAVFALDDSNEQNQEKKLSEDEKFARDEASREQEKAALELEKANAEIEVLRLESEGIAAEDELRAQQETDLMRQELEKELALLYERAEKRAEERRKALERDELKALNEYLDKITQETKELDKDLQRIRLRPPKP